MLLTGKAGLKVVGAWGEGVSALGPLLPRDPCPSTQAWTSARGLSGLALFVPPLWHKAGGLGSVRLRPSRGSRLVEPPSRALPRALPLAGPPPGARRSGRGRPARPRPRCPAASAPLSAARRLRAIDRAAGTRARSDPTPSLFAFN